MNGGSDTKVSMFKAILNLIQVCICWEIWKNQKGGRFERTTLNAVMQWVNNVYHIILQLFIQILSNNISVLWAIVYEIRRLQDLLDQMNYSLIHTLREKNKGANSQPIWDVLKENPSSTLGVFVVQIRKIYPIYVCKKCM